MSFFSLDEITFFKQWAYQDYEPQNPKHRYAKNVLMDTVWEKSFLLAKKIKEELPDFEIKGGKYWSQRGWREVSGKNKQSAKFKPYTWVKIHRRQDDGKDVFFTFGVDAQTNTNSFIYKIDLRRTRDSRLSIQQIDLADSIIPSTAKWGFIPFAELLDLDIESLISVCVNFINDNLLYYDQVIEMIKTGQISHAPRRNLLTKHNTPKNNTVKKRKRTYKGIDIDFIEQNIFLKKIGDLGELLAINVEKEFLENNGKHDLATKVAKIKDGKGFDILSFNLDGTEKFIEVKTTIGPANKPFFLSDNEYEFMLANLSNYYIYRIYNYNETLNIGDYYILKDDVEEQIVCSPILYRVDLK